ncbi:hypothetical protein [Pseudomaricurvus sp. HS19]|uniref:hypothetical protein n=1 Tax=Pseudomaricurvus sp. HS19 TaxID=2692626 RepID=UPI001368DBE5|nr:hypothetical protein [Pseudomaricurvus sp. HS19]MYM63836.1 hypothetical protein [Pseudomaricurvus sp. HS19]
MKWHFSPQLADQVETEVTQRDQFNNDEVDLAETIVREAVQNSLDAAVDDPMRVKVTFRWISQNEGLDPDFFKELFDKQLDHAKAADLDVDDLDFGHPEALVIEDYGTSGLTGSISDKDNNHFSDFWRRHGKSHKTGKSRGRWGLGKLVYSTTSRVGVFFGVTVREGDPGNHLMGQTVLNLRVVDGVQYPPHAFYSDLENEDDLYRRIPVPIKSADFVSKFVKNFSLRRDESPGLSVVIPFPNQKFNVDHMIGVAIGNYFYPLITGQLVLQFNDMVIDGSNVREFAKKYASNRFHQIDLLFDFVEEVYAAEQSSLLKLKPSWLDDKRLDQYDFDPNDLENIRDRFSSGKLVGVSLPVKIKRKNPKEDEDSYFSVYIKRPEELTKGLDLYVRGGLTLPGEAKFRDRRALGAMIAEHEPICALLGDAENAAHTQWTTNTEKLTKNYRNTQPTITVIKKSVQHLYDLLAEVTEEKDEDALQSFFWFEEPDDKKNKRKRKKPNPPSPIPPIPPSRPAYTISQIAGGFSISNGEGLTDTKLPKELSVEVAYEVVKGNAFKKYNPLDFKVGKGGSITLSATEGVKIIVARENTWTFEISKIPFKLKALGFDETRDLKIKTS